MQTQLAEALESREHAARLWARTLCQQWAGEAGVGRGV